MKWFIAIILMFLFFGCYTVVFNVEDENYASETDSTFTGQNEIGYYNVGGYTRLPVWYTWDAYNHEYYWDDWGFWGRRPFYYPRPPLFVRPYWTHWNRTHHKTPSIHSDYDIVRRDGGYRRDIKNSTVIPRRTSPNSAQDRRERIIQDFNKNRPVPPTYVPNRNKNTAPEMTRQNNTSVRQTVPPTRQESKPSTPQIKNDGARPDTRSRR